MLFFLFALFQIALCDKMTPEQAADVGKLILTDPKALIPMMQHAKKSDIGAVIKMLSTRIHTLDDEKAHIKAKIAANKEKQEKIAKEMEQQSQQQEANAGEEQPAAVDTPVAEKSVAAPVPGKATNLMATLKKVANSKNHKASGKKGGLGGILAILPLLLKGLGGH